MNGMWIPSLGGFLTFCGYLVCMGGLALLSVPVIVSILYIKTFYPPISTEASWEPSNVPTDKLGLERAEQQLSIRGCHLF